MGYHKLGVEVGVESWVAISEEWGEEIERR